MRAYVDSDVLIWHLRGKSKAFDFLKELRSKAEYELWVGALQRAEVVFFMRPGEEDKTELFLSEFATAPVDREIVDVAGRLYRSWNPSHGIDVNDAFLAATALKTGGKIYTLNRKHYPMPDLLVEQAF
jgi:predicted nucleic acid-binding protein